MDELKAINWIEKNLSPEFSTSEEFIYNEMESQSCYSLPVIYQPFDSTKKSHWADRGSLFDYLYSTNGGGKLLLDFGPGDGWPSLIVAPHAAEVVGIDSSPRRVKVCSQNAKRLGIRNVKFVSYKVGEKLPFEDNSFDGIMAASSIEQTPDPKATLKELFRVLKPGGRLRFKYEALEQYRNSKEKDVWIAELTDNSCKLVLYVRDLKQECVTQYGITVSLSKREIVELLKRDGGTHFTNITVRFLESIRPRIIGVQICRLKHPSGRTYISWLKEIGFKEVLPTHSGADAAAKLFEHYKQLQIPDDIESVDRVIKPVVRVAVQLSAPIETDPMITAVK